MPAVGHLLGIRGGSTGRVGIGAGPVPGDHLDLRMQPQPGHHRCRVALGQQLDRAALLEVDDDRAVLVATGQRPVVDADDDGHRLQRRTAGAAQFPQHRRPADAHAQACRQPGGRLAAEGVAEREMPPKPSEVRFYGQLLKAIGAPQRSHERLATVEPVTLALLHEIKPRMLVVDEVHNLLAGSAREQRVALNLLKFIANDLSCSVVALGTRDARAVMQTDAQIASRFRPMELPRWQDDDALARFLRSYEKLLPLKNPSRLAERALLAPILKRSGGVTGEICALLTAGAERAIRGGDERITRDILEAVTLTGKSH